MNHDKKPTIEAPIADRLSKRIVAPPTPSLLDAPLPTPSSGAQGPLQAGPTGRPERMMLPNETPDLSLGAFFAQNKALVDERRHHLDRMGMDPRHVAALRMPELDDMPAAPAVLAENLPPVNMADGKAEPKAERNMAPAMPEGEVQ